MGQGTIPDDWEGEYCRYAICWPKSPQWEAILRGILTIPARGRFWDAHTGIIIEAQSVIRETFDYNLHLKGVIMACEDTGLAEIATALRLLANSQCCGSGPPSTGGITIVVTTPEGATVPLYGSEEPAILEPGNVPDGYEGTEEEYLADKCRTAHSIVDAWIATLNNLSYINFAQTNGLLLVILAAVAGLIILPEFVIPALIGAAIVLVAARELLRQLAEHIEENRSEIVCIMYQFDNTQEIFGRLADLMDIIIAAMATTTLFGAALKTIALVLITSNTLNQLFNLTQGQGNPDVDCSECTEGWIFFQTASGNPAGTLVSGSMEWDSELFVVAAFQEIAGDGCPGDWIVSIGAPPNGREVNVNLAGGTLTDSACGTGWAYTRASDHTQISFNDGTYNFDTEIGSQLIEAFFVRSTVSFSIEVNIL